MAAGGGGATGILAGFTYLGAEQRLMAVSNL
jgi:hypothetical protein